MSEEKQTLDKRVICVYREFAQFARLADFVVEIDGQSRGSIQCRETLEFPVELRFHEIKILFPPFGTSPIIRLDLTTSGWKSVKCQLSSAVFRQLADRSRRIDLCEVEDELPPQSRRANHLILRITTFLIVSIFASIYLSLNSYPVAYVATAVIIIGIVSAIPIPVKHY